MPDLLGDHAIIEGHRIACGVQGEGAPVVLIHGTPSHSTIWRNVAPRIAAAGYRVHLYDLLGFGRSERPLAADTSVGAQVPLLGALLDYWGLDHPHVVAHDIGGAVALRFGVFHPARMRTLTLIDTVSYDSWPSATWRKIIAERLDSFAAMPAEEHRERLTRQLRMTVHDKAKMAGATLGAYLDAISGPIGQPSFFFHQVRHYDSIYTEEISARLGELALPVQILWGAEDEWQPASYARRLAEDIPGAELHIVPQAGHFLMEDKPDVVADRVVAFIDDKG